MTPRSEPTLERLHAQAASGVAGAKRAQHEIRLATLRGLAAVTGKPMPRLAR